MTSKRMDIVMEKYVCERKRAKREWKKGKLKTAQQNNTATMTRKRKGRKIITLWRIFSFRKTEEINLLFLSMGTAVMWCGNWKISDYLFACSVLCPSLQGAWRTGSMGMRKCWKIIDFFCVDKWNSQFFICQFFSLKIEFSFFFHEPRNYFDNSDLQIFRFAHLNFRDLSWRTSNERSQWRFLGV